MNDELEITNWNYVDLCLKNKKHVTLNLEIPAKTYLPPFISGAKVIHFRKYFFFIRISTDYSARTNT